MYSEVNKQSGIQPEIAGLLKKRLLHGGTLDGDNLNHTNLRQVYRTAPAADRDYSRHRGT